MPEELRPVWVLTKNSQRGPEVLAKDHLGPVGWGLCGFGLLPKDFNISQMGSLEPRWTSQAVCCVLEALN